MWLSLKHILSQVNAYALVEDLGRGVPDVHVPAFASPPGAQSGQPSRTACSSGCVDLRALLAVNAISPFVY